MELRYKRCAGIDIGKKYALVTIRFAGAGRRKTRYTTKKYLATTPSILALRDELVQAKVGCVVMESTGQYWKPFYYGMEGAGFKQILANARTVKNIPDEKSDVSDSRWLADLGAHGLVRPSFVPPPPIRQLRDLTRDRTAMMRERAKLLTRVQEVLEDAGIKLGTVASDINGVSSRKMLEAMIGGERDPFALTELAKGRLRAKKAALQDALTGRFTEHHAFRLQQLLEQTDRLQGSIDAYTERIDQTLGPYRSFRDQLCTIPGVGVLTAQVIIAETGADMSVFPSPKHLSSWAGVSPGSNESAGVVHPVKTGHGNKHLKAALGVMAMSISHTKNTYLATRHHRIAARRGPKKALVATEHKVLEIIWHMGTTNTPYRDLGADYFATRDPAKATRRALNQLHSLGYDVTITPAAS
jgi:transposase